MNRLPLPRWAVSFADLVLLLLGCFVLLHAMEAQGPSGGRRAVARERASGGAGRAPSTLPKSSSPARLC